MATSGTFGNSENFESNSLWQVTWTRVHSFLPGLKAELFPPVATVPASGNQHIVSADDSVALPTGTPDVHADAESSVPHHLEVGGPAPENIPEESASDKEDLGRFADAPVSEPLS